MCMQDNKKIHKSKRKALLSTPVYFSCFMLAHFSILYTEIPCLFCLCCTFPSFLPCRPQCFLVHCIKQYQTILVYDKSVKFHLAELWLSFINGESILQ